MSAAASRPAGDPASPEDLGWVVERMPHAPPMRLVDAVRAVDGDAGTLTAEATIGPDHLLLEDGRVTGLAAIELIAQAAAALVTYRAYRAGEPGAEGFLLGTRRLEVPAGGFAPGDRLTIHVAETWGAGPLAHFDGRIERGGAVVAAGSIHVARTR